MENQTTTTNTWNRFFSEKMIIEQDKHNFQNGVNQITNLYNIENNNNIFNYINDCILKFIGTPNGDFSFRFNISESHIGISEDVKHINSYVDLTFCEAAQIIKHTNEYTLLCGIPTYEKLAKISNSHIDNHVTSVEFEKYHIVVGLAIEKKLIRIKINLKEISVI